MANRLNTILNADWNATIITKPTFVELSTGMIEPYDVAIGSKKIQRSDELKGIMSRQYFSIDSHDAFQVKCVHTSQANVDLLVKGIQEVAATYAGAATEVIIEWDTADLNIFNDQRYTYTFIVFLKKAGIAGY